MLEPSPRYFAALEATQEHHARSKTFDGRFLLRYRKEIKAIIDEFGIRTMLDYGCGKGRQWRDPINDEGLMLADYFGVDVTKYDPAWPDFAAEPVGKFDIVVCTQVLGSIPIGDLPWAVNRLYSFAEKAVFVGENLGPVKKVIHDHMKAEMPHGWDHDQWAAAVKHPGPVPGYLKTINRHTGKSRFEAV